LGALEGLLESALHEGLKEYLGRLAAAARGACPALAGSAGIHRGAAILAMSPHGQNARVEYIVLIAMFCCLFILRNVFHIYPIARNMLNLNH
jgi:hypothetical protein